MSYYEIYTNSFGDLILVELISSVDMPRAQKEIIEQGYYIIGTINDTMFRARKIDEKEI